MTKKFGLLGLAISATLLTGCFSKDDNKSDVELGNDIAFIQSISSDYKESMIEKTDGKSVESRFLNKEKSDYTVFAKDEYVYHLGKMGIDTIQKYKSDNLSKGYYPGEGFSLNKAGETTSANPYNIAFLDKGQAVITRYNAKEAWVVNLEAQNADDFLIKELDLSHHATSADKIPEMNMVFAYKNKVFISLQNLDNWASTGDEKLVVFDRKTWNEIDTDPSKEGVQAIELGLKNHQDGVKQGNKIYLASLVYPAWGSSEPATGGIEVVNLDSYGVSTLYNKKGISQIAINDSDKIFFADYAAYQSSSLYKLNADGSESLVSNDLKEKDLTALATKEDAVWLGFSADSKNQVLYFDGNKDFSQPVALADLKLGLLETALVPSKIVFADKK